MTSGNARRPLRLALAGAGAAALAAAHPAEAKITRIDILSSGPAYAGQSFGAVGTYTQYAGVAYGEVDPADPLNAGIQDIRLASRLPNGHVAYSMDVTILAPTDPARGNGVLFYDVVNRGGPSGSSLLNVGASGTTAAGDGFLQGQGYTIVWSGWQGDLVKTATNFKLYAPTAENNGQTLTGVVRSEISMLIAPVPSSPILGGFSAGSAGYPPVSFDTTKATLTQRVHQEDPRQPIPASQWAYATCSAATPFPGTPDYYGMPQYQLCLNGGFSPNYIYELTYQAQDPLVLGLGFASTRDLVSYLRHHDGAGNPVAGSISNAVIFGVSQSGRYTRTFIDLGFNQDESRRIVFDGAQPHIASSRIALNIRFGQPGRVAGLQHTEHDYPGQEPNYSWSTTRDPLSGVKTGILARCEAANTCPKVVQTVSDIEYWQSGMSDDTTDSFGAKDLALPSNVRLYHLASTQHGGYAPQLPLPTATPAACQNLQNANSYTYNLRALFTGLTNWVKTGAAPVASAYPKLSGGTLVRYDMVNFPTIPNVSEELGDLLNQRPLFYRGPQFRQATTSGVETVEPPVQLADYTVLVPQTDANGNDLDGVRSLSLMAPLGTYTGWNTRAAGFGQGDACDLTGSFIPFAATDAAKAAGDPRPSLASLYGSHANYQAALNAAAATLLAKGWLLAPDEATAVAQAYAQALPLLAPLP